MYNSYQTKLIRPTHNIAILFNKALIKYHTNHYNNTTDFNYKGFLNYVTAQ